MGFCLCYLFWLPAVSIQLFLRPNGKLLAKYLGIVAHIHGKPRMQHKMPDAPGQWLLVGKCLQLGKQMLLFGWRQGLLKLDADKRRFFGHSAIREVLSREVLSAPVV